MSAANSLSFFVAGQPVPKARPRVVKGHAFTASRTAAWEEAVGWAAKVATDGSAPFAGPCRVDLDFYGARANADIDNLQKAVLDGLNGIAYLDDKQVVEVHATRSVSDPRKGVQIQVVEVP